MRQKQKQRQDKTSDVSSGRLSSSGIQSLKYMYFKIRGGLVVISNINPNVFPFEIRPGHVTSAEVFYHRTKWKSEP